MLLLSELDQIVDTRYANRPSFNAHPKSANLWWPFSGFRKWLQEHETRTYGIKRIYQDCETWAFYLFILLPPHNHIDPWLFIVQSILSLNPFTYILLFLGWKPKLSDWFIVKQQNSQSVSDLNKIKQFFEIKIVLNCSIVLNYY